MEPQCHLQGNCKKAGYGEIRALSLILTYKGDEKVPELVQGAAKVLAKTDWNNHIVRTWEGIEA